MTNVIHDEGTARDTLRRCPVGTKIQSLVFDRDAFSEREAAIWAKRHGFVAPHLDVTTNTIRIRQEEPSDFVEGSLRTVRLREGVKAVVGCPKPNARENPTTAEDHVHVTGGAIPVPDTSPAPKDEACGCTPTVQLVRSEGYEACLASAQKLGAIRNAKKVYALLETVMVKQEQETLVVVPLDARYQLRGGVVEVHRGAIASVAVSSMSVMRAVIATQATSFLVAHNHPSGRCSPSRADIALTRHLDKSVKAFSGEVLMLDHVIVGRKEFYSIREKKLYRVPAK